MIIRFLTIPEIQKMYKGKKINKNHPKQSGFKEFFEFKIK